MRHFILASTLSLFFINIISSQETPTIPNPPETETKITYSKTVSNSVTNSGINQQSSSVSVKNNNNTYKLTAKFHKSKTSKLKKVLIDNLGKFDVVKNENTFQWIKNKNGEKLYNYQLNNTSLKIYANKKLMTSYNMKKISDLGNQLKNIISNNSSYTKKEQTERELQKAERRLALAKREVTLAKREMELAKKNNLNK